LNVYVGVERLLRIRGLLEPAAGSDKVFENKKEEQEHLMTTRSNYLGELLNEEEVGWLNE
jgi:hypothetical protein